MPILPHARSVDPPASPADVVVTGLGMITALGNGIDANAEGFRLGRPALRPITLFDTSRFGVHVAAEVDLPAAIPTHALPPADVRRLERGGMMLLLAADEALRSAGAGANTRLRDMPVVLGTSAGAMSHGEAFYRRAVAGGSRIGQPTRAASYLLGYQADLVARAHGLRGDSLVISNACASGANAIGHAWQWIRAGRAERVLAGGYDALCELVFAGFDALKALSRTTPRPFAADRDGLALGEGAAMFVLESRGAAEARGAAILATIAGYGMATDCHHLTQPHPDGVAAIASMTMATRAAGLQPGDIQYINSHGTGTPLNDPAEAAAIMRWAGPAAGQIVVSSTKGAIGHVLGGAGAIEAAVCILAMRGGFVPPTAHTRVPDACCGFDLAIDPRAAVLDVTLSNSFGFGGSNATLIFRRSTP